jgi:Trypsin
VKRKLLKFASQTLSTPTFFQRISVRLGEHTISTAVDCESIKDDMICNMEPLQNIPIESAIVHENYVPNVKRKDHRGGQNDIALIKLKSDAKFNFFVSPVCLPTEANSPPADVKQKEVLVAGWGVTDKGDYLSLRISDICNLS